MQQGSPLFQIRRREASASVPAAEAFFQTIAARLRARMVNRSASDIPIRVSGVEIRQLGEVQDEPEFRESAIIGPLWIGSSRMPGMILMQHDLLTRLIAVLLGEELEDTDAPAQMRSLSPVESRIAGRMCADLLMETERNWPESTPPRIAFNGLSTTHRELDPSTSTVPVYSATFDFGAVDAPLGLMVLALPVHALASFASAEPEEENPEPPRRQTLDSVMPVEVEVVVELTHLKLTVNELRELMPGDVLNLGSMRDAVIKVNGLALFEGQAGVSGGVRSVKLRRRRIP